MRKCFIANITLFLMLIFLCSCSSLNATPPKTTDEVQEKVIKAVPNGFRISPLGFYRESSNQQYFSLFHEATSLFSVVDQELLPISKNLTHLSGVTMTKDGTMIVFRDKKYFLADLDGTPLSDIRADYITDLSSNVSGRFAYVMNGQYGLLDKEGKTMLSPRYSFIGGYGDGLLFFIQNGKYGYIDTNGIEIIPANYELPHDIEIDHTDANGPYPQDSLSKFSDNCSFSFGCARYQEKAQWGVIGKDGSTILDANWYDIQILNGYIKVYQDNLTNISWGLMDLNGNYLTQMDYDETNQLLLMENNWISISLKDGYKYLNSRVAPFNSPYTIKSRQFSEDMAVIESKNGKKGYINSAGTIVVEPVWKSASEFHEGLGGVVDSEGFINYVDKDGNLIFPLKKFHSLSRNAENYSNGLVAIEEVNGKYGYLNTKGESVVSAQWHNAFEFYNERAIVKGEAGFGLINQNGDVVISPRWSMINIIDDNQLNTGEYYIVLNGFGTTRPVYGCFSRDGKEVIKARFDEIDYIGNGVFICKNYEICGPDFQKVYNTFIIF